MGLLGKILGTDKAGKRAADASVQAAQIQADATRSASQLQAQTTREQLAANQRAIDTARSDLQPFRQLGVDSIGGLQEAQQGIQTLATDQNAQADFVTNNPFFKALADDAQRRLFNNQAARGKVGTGGTAEALQNSVLLLGNDLVDKQLNRSQNAFNNAYNITTLGSNAAAGQATATQQGTTTGANIAQLGTRNITDLATQGANATASGIVGAANARNAANQSAIDAGLGIGALGVLALSDEREKKDIKFLGMVENIPYYLFKYKNGSKLEFGTMAQKIEHIKDAVLDFGGKKYVNYGVLHGN